MARRKRLNRRVAWIGGIVLLVLAVSAVLILSRLTQDPKTLVEDADAAFAAGDYDGARRGLSRAYDAARDPATRVDLLFRLAQVYVRTGDWTRVMGCWERVLQEDLGNIKARLALLETRTLQADAQVRLGSADPGIWKDIEARATELLEVVTQAGVAGRDRAEWRVPDLDDTAGPPGPEPVGVYGHGVRGRALYQQARLGAVASPREWLDKAEADFRKVLDMDPAHVEAHRYLSKVAAERAAILAAEGNAQGAEQAKAEVIRILEQCVAAAGSQPRSHLYLMESQLDRVLTGDAEEAIAARLTALEPRVLELSRSFSEDAEVCGTAAKFFLVQALYQGPGQRSAYLGKAIEAAHKATALEPSRVDFALALAELYYRRAVLLGQAADADTARSTAQGALGLPGARETAGPRAYVHKANRYGICVFLAQCAVDQVLAADPSQAEQVAAQWLPVAEEAVQQVRQIVGSGDAPEVVRWNSLLDLAKGDVDRAVGPIWAGYEKAKASSPSRRPDPWVAYVLGRVFMDSAEQGQALRCLADALRGGVGFNRPSAILDYLELLGRMDMWTHVTSKANAYNLDVYERQFGPGPRSRALRIRTLIGTHRIPEAEQELARTPLGEATAIQLRLELLQVKTRQAQGALMGVSLGDGRSGIFMDPAPGPEGMSEPIRQLRQQEVELVTRLLEADPNAVSEPMMVSVYQALVAQGRIVEAKQRVDRYLAAHPQRAAVLFTRLILDEPDPRNVTPTRRDQLFAQAVSKLTDPVRQATELGLFYRHTDRPQEALAQFLKVLDADPKAARPAGEPRTQVPFSNPVVLAAGMVFDMAVEQQDWTLAERVVDRVRQGDLDGCAGTSYEARLAHARGSLQEALAKMHAALERRPVFAHGYLARAKIQEALGNRQAALEDLDRATQLSPTSPAIAKSLAIVLAKRNRAMEAGATEDQQTEARVAVERALSLDPSDTVLLALYAEQLASTDPFKALQVYQIIHRKEPSVQNAVGLGSLATSLAAREPQTTRGAALLDLARVSFEQAYAAEPNNPDVLRGYAQYLRASGQSARADQVLESAGEAGLTWRGLLRQGKVLQAKAFLERSHQADPTQIDTLQGLVFVAEMTRDAEGLERYSDALVAAHDTANNRVDQVIVFLRTGLVHQAAIRLERLKARYPGEARAALLEAWVMLRRGQLPGARQAIDQVLQSDPHNAMAWSIRGQVCLAEGEPDLAIESLAKAKGLREDPTVRLGLAQAYAQADRPQDAVAELRGILTEPAVAWQAVTMLDRLLSGLGRTADLAEVYALVERTFPDDAQWINRAAAFAFSQQDRSKAEQLYAKVRTIKAALYADSPSAVLGLDSDYAAACEGHLQVLLSLAGDDRDRLEAVIREGTQYAGSRFEPWVLGWVARARLKLGDRPGALEDCRRAIRMAESDPGLLGQLVRHMAVRVGAEEIVGQAFAGQADALTSHAVLLHLAALNERTQEAIAQADRCLSLAGPEGEARRFYTTVKADLLALAYHRGLDDRYLHEAITQYESLADKTPTDSSVLNNLAYLLAEGGVGLARAMEYAKTAYELRPNSAVILDTYGYVLHQDGRHQQALEMLSAACQQFRINDGDCPADVYEHLGMVREALGDKVKALRDYQQALDVGTRPGARLSPRAGSRIRAAIERLRP